MGYEMTPWLKPHKTTKCKKTTRLKVTKRGLSITIESF